MFITRSRTSDRPTTRQISQVKLTIANTLFSITYALPFTIAYFVVFSKTDPSTCRGEPYEYGSFARWAFLSGVIHQVVTFPFNLRIAIKKDYASQSRLEWMIWVLSGLCTAFFVGVWIYACVALSKRGECSGSLMILLWLTVFIPVGFCAFACCCCACFGIMTGCAGIVGLLQHQPEGDNNPNLKVKTISEKDMLRQMQEDLEQEKKKIERRVSQQNTQTTQVDIA